jgi:cyanophycinase
MHYKMVKNSILIIIALAITGCNDPGNHKKLLSNSTGPENGYLIAAGGNLTDTAVFMRFMELSGGPDKLIIIVSTARTDAELADDLFYEQQDKRFRGYGFQNFKFLHTRDREMANSEEFVEPLKNAQGVWFLGGRQWRLVDAYAGTKTLEAFWELLDRGGVIGGSSAGASIQASYLVRGDTKTNTVMMGDHEAGFGFLTNTAIDQHLLAMNRQFDIFEILDVHPGMLGLGLDENTAIVVHRNQFEVLGESYVAVYDGTFYKEVRDKDDWNHMVAEIEVLPPDSRKFYLLKSGEKYDLYNRRVVR